MPRRFFRPPVTPVVETADSRGVIMENDTIEPTAEDAENCFRRRLSITGSASFWVSKTFADTTMRMYYERYRIDNVLMLKTHMFLLFCGMITFLLGFYTSLTVYDKIWIVRTIIFCRIVLLAASIYLCLKIRDIQRRDDTSEASHRKQVFLVTNLTSWFLICMAIVNGSMFIWKSHLGQCGNSNSKDTVYLFDCNEGYETGGTAYFASFVLLIANTYLVAVFRCHHFWAIQASYVITCLSCFAAAAVSRRPFQATLVITYALLLIFMYKSMEMNDITTFIALLDLEKNKREKTHNMKFFIGNVSLLVYIYDQAVFDVYMCFTKVAHDLKTPLHTLSICIDSILEEYCKELSANVIEMLETCQVNASFMSMAISRTVDFTKSTSNIALIPRKETVSLKAAVQWAVQCVSHSISNKRISIEVKPMPVDVSDKLVTDKHWLMENLLCYLSNAVKYSFEGKIFVHFSLSKTSRPICQQINTAFNTLLDELQGPYIQEEMDSAQQYLLVAVEDEGIGVTDSSKLFQPFSQTMKLAGGTGLGLFSLANRVKALKGDYGVCGRLDGKTGSQFWFSIPYVPDQDVDHNNSSEHVGDATSSHVFFSSRTLSPRSDAMMFEGMKALVAEDSVVIAKSTKKMLSKAGYSVDCVENGVVALDYMKKSHYDIVLIDLQMPIMDGLEATRRMREYENDPTTQKNGRPPLLIVGLSANEFDDVHVAAMTSGMNAFYTKPFSFQNLLDLQKRNCI